MPIMKHLFLLAVMATAFAATAQKITNKLTFHPGQKLEMVIDMKSTVSQEMMGQSMEMKLGATSTRTFDVNSVANGNAAIEHKVKRIQFSFEGMGKTETFDSDNDSDMKKEGAKEIQKSLKNKYKMTVDNTGKILSVTPDDDNPNVKKTDDDNADSMAGMMDQIFSGTDLPEAGDATEFKVLPNRELSKGDSWTDTTARMKDEKRTATYTVTDINKEEVLIDYTEESTSKITQENMGMEVTLNRQDSTTGHITLDRKTGLLKQQQSATTSNGTAEVMGQSVPITSKITKTITVKGI